MTFTLAAATWAETDSTPKKDKASSDCKAEAGAEKCDVSIIKKYDVNGDGQLDENEKTAMKKDLEAAKAKLKAKVPAKILEQYDLNKDGVLDENEKTVMKQDAERHRLETEAAQMVIIKKHDLNGDGKLDDAEKAAMREAAKHKAIKKQ